MNILPYLTLAGLWIIYFLLHSLLATSSVKNYVRRMSGILYRYYRLLYNIFAIITLLPVLYYNARISSGLLIAPQAVEFVKFAGMVMATYGIIVIRLAFRHYDLRRFLGIKPAEKQEPLPLQTSGIFRYVRHPLYAGTILIFIGFWLFSPTLANLVTSAMVIIYILIGIRPEERKLIKTYGQPYVSYQQQVPMLIPSLRKRKR